MDKNLKIWLTSVGIFLGIIVVISLALSQNIQFLQDLFGDLFPQQKELHTSALESEFLSYLQNHLGL